jgi:predicted RNA-binding Zn-ribbon protein involved in translation (DUF1610 family)
MTRPLCACYSLAARRNSLRLTWPSTEIDGAGISYNYEIAWHLAHCSHLKAVHAPASPEHGFRLNFPDDWNPTEETAVYFHCFSCKEVALLIDATKEECPLCGSANGVVVSYDRVRKGTKGGGTFNKDPKRGKGAKSKRHWPAQS